MKITFIGATHEVTGSCYYLEAAGKKFLVDCGLEQGPDYYENRDIPGNPADIDFVLLTHAPVSYTHLNLRDFLRIRFICWTGEQPIRR